MTEESKYKQIWGKIERTSPYGFQIDKLGESWVNYGKFFEGDKTPVEVGASVIISYQQSGDKFYLNSVAKADSNPDPDPHNAIKDLVTDSIMNEADRRQIVIVRQNCIGNAVNFHQDIGSETDVETVLRTAETFERWIHRK
tara:strand:- start:736 stop:1158 length:423 start_codon:yes stop_codon:yes gene_type:complete